VGRVRWVETIVSGVRWVETIVGWVQWVETIVSGVQWVETIVSGVQWVETFYSRPYSFISLYINILKTTYHTSTIRVHSRQYIFVRSSIPHSSTVDDVGGSKLTMSDEAHVTFGLAARVVVRCVSPKAAKRH
jgi:hypothetical protein